MGLTTLEALTAERGRKQILGQLDPWDNPNFAATVQGVRTQGARRLEDLRTASLKSGIGGPAAGTLLEKSGEATGGNVLDLANQMREGQEGYVAQGISGEEASAGRDLQVQQMAMQKKIAKYGKQGGYAKYCCFIFIEGEMLTPYVREYRDELFPPDSYVSKGYIRMARWLVPLMKKSTLIKKLVKMTMLSPIAKFCEHTHNNERKLKFNKDLKGVLYAPVALFWVSIWEGIGRLDDFSYCPSV